VKRFLGEKSPCGIAESVGGRAVGFTGLGSQRRFDGEVGHRGSEVV